MLMACSIKVGVLQGSGVRLFQKLPLSICQLLILVLLLIFVLTLALVLILPEAGQMRGHRLCACCAEAPAVAGPRLEAADAGSMRTRAWGTGCCTGTDAKTGHGTAYVRSGEGGAEACTFFFGFFSLLCFLLAAGSSSDEPGKQMACSQQSASCRSTLRLHRDRLHRTQRSALASSSCRFRFCVMVAK